MGGAGGGAAAVVMEVPCPHYGAAADTFALHPALHAWAPAAVLATLSAVCGAVMKEKRVLPRTPIDLESRLAVMWGG